MTEFNRTESAAGAAAPAAPIAAMLREAESWTRAQCELLSGIEAIWAQWMQRQRAAIDASAGALQQMTGCRNFVDLMHIQQQWFADAVRRGASDVSALTSDAVALGRLAAGMQTSRAGAPDRPSPPRTAPPAHAGEHRAEQRQAAE